MKKLLLLLLITASGCDNCFTSTLPTKPSVKMQLTHSELQIELYRLFARQQELVPFFYACKNQKKRDSIQQQIHDYSIKAEEVYHIMYNK